jgi:hypothetical protein
MACAFFCPDRHPAAEGDRPFCLLSSLARGARPESPPPGLVEGHLGAAFRLRGKLEWFKLASPPLGPSCLRGTELAPAPSSLPGLSVARAGDGRLFLVDDWARRPPLEPCPPSQPAQRLLRAWLEAPVRGSGAGGCPPALWPSLWALYLLTVACGREAGLLILGSEEGGPAWADLAGRMEGFLESCGDSWVRESVRLFPGPSARAS